MGGSVGHRGVGGIFSRRNKCLVVTLIFTIALLIFLMNAGLFSNVSSYTGELCKVDDIPLQKNLNKKKFSGNWFVSNIKGLDNKLLATMMDFSDVKINFVYKDENNYDIRSVGGKMYGWWCPIGEGHVPTKDNNSPQKMQIFFDTSTGKKFGTKDLWVVKTDYTSYTILYSCWDVTSDGRCEAKGAYLAVLKRNTDPLPQSVLDEINSTVQKCCINPGSLRVVRHDGYCKKEHVEIS
ncbi:PURP-like protein [Mya arenaria]|uniref:PURP-like protein n=1 Tax=Mya arenaria TaxID=6604 RepID=A0ABY7EN24_MYAAR|nr:purpurin-like [Mya arenaria]WAR10028.1 PURP-like protein [Mya arenaria]